MERHDAEAAGRFPGPDYRQVLQWLHQELRPQVYVEIGIFKGDTLRLAEPPTIAVGVDPAPDTPGHWAAETHIFPMTSARFFAQEELKKICAPDQLGLAFIDGLHLFEQTLQDLLDLEPYAGPGTVFALHDTIPLNRETAARVRATEFHTGDVWKTVAFLREQRPELEILTIRAAPTGLTLIRGLGTKGAAVPGPDEGQVRRYAGLDWSYFEAHHGEFLNLAPNDRTTVQSFCQ